MVPGKTNPLFTSDDVKELRRVGLAEVQIEKLEKVLPLAQGLLKKASRLLDVRAEFGAVIKPLRQAEKAIAKLLNPRAPAARFEVVNRATLEDFERNGHGDTLMSALVAIGNAHALLTAASENAGGKQRVRNEANPKPVELIDRALREGYAASLGFIPTSRTVDGRTVVAGGRLLQSKGKPKGISLKPAKEGAFADIVGICYGAMGMNPNPVKAIRAYLEQRRARWVGK